MQRTTALLSLSIPFLKPQKSPSGFYLNPRPRHNPTILNDTSFESLLISNSCFHGTSCANISLLRPYLRSSSSFQHWAKSQGDGSRIKATAIPDSSSESDQTFNAIAQNLQLGSMFGIWYLLNIYFNIFNKQVLKTFPFPLTITAFELGCGTLMIIIMWTLNLHKKPKLTHSQLMAILPLALVHTMGNLLTNISLGKVAVSFTHTIKAMEPFFTVLFASIFLGQRPSLGVVSSLIPVICGVALASFTEASFNWTGFCSAMASNVTNQSRNVLSKKFMIKNKETLDNISIFSVITIISFMLLGPAAILFEGVKFSPSYLLFAAKQGLNVKELCIRCLLAGFCFHGSQQVSYMILEMVNPVTHAVGNCVKRVVVIVTSVIFFQTIVSPVNSLGTALALVGVFLYSRAKRQ